ncbi:PLDc N-terminal domain-containing protein [Anaerocolumna aminovalerica]|uniref:PLDc N-terminal domain-containing protein n=1 Tax=Anaerocolumna aminovalerica TaxID=1527 RepID=UPI003BEED964
MVIKYHQYFVLYYIVKFIISFIAMLWIINKRMNPTFVVTWLFTIFLFPVFGVLVYILYGGKLTGKKNAGRTKFHIFQNTIRFLPWKRCHSFGTERD